LHSNSVEIVDTNILLYYYYVDIQLIVVFQQHLVVNTMKYYLMLYLSIEAFGSTSGGSNWLIVEEIIIKIV